MIAENILVKSNYDSGITNSFSYSNLPRFRWFGYKEGFSPNLVIDAIDKVGIAPDEYILDPFNGNGTVTLTASNNNIQSIGLEVNPFTAFMAKTKQLNAEISTFDKCANEIYNGISKQARSKLLNFSTFSELSGKRKWLFNSDVLNSFEGGWVSTIPMDNSLQAIFRLALIGAANDNCNASKDGKCLKYRDNWQARNYNKETYLLSFRNRILNIRADLMSYPISKSALIINCDSREYIDKLENKFKLCITSPPYLNSFDYTDIYRPELFLGRFVKDNNELNSLRYNTIRSHVEMNLPDSKDISFGLIYDEILSRLNGSSYLWDKQIPKMVRGYFEDMDLVLAALKNKAQSKAQLWLVVANSVYANIEIPVDLILAEIGSRRGWRLQRIEVIRNIQRRKTKYNGDIHSVRESLIVFKNE